MPHLNLKKAAILGATGPTGIHLTHELLSRGLEVRVVARHAAGLANHFQKMAAERMAADMLDPEAARRAIDGCDIVFDCIGLPADRIADHPTTARHIAAAIGQTGARCVQISSFWAYLPIVKLPLDERHPRSGGVHYVQIRREAEDILHQAGAAVINLPDFFGPQVHTSTFQQPLQEAARGETVNWIGARDTEREYIYVPDAMRLAATLAGYEEAYGEYWIFPGGGPLSANRFAEIAGRHLHRSIKVRSAGYWTLRLVSLFSKPLRQFMSMAEYYLQPIAYDGAKLRNLLGPLEMTPYEKSIPQTLNWLRR